jgi:CTP:molybdopterin cytidylyltransferase MocA/SAM-dependent methyltransferase
VTAALILAAGRGTRFGGGKMLAPIDGRPMLQHVLDLAAAAGLAPVAVVLGEDADAIEVLVSWRDEQRVRNEDPGRGLSSSLKLGLDALGESDRVIVLLGDQPRLTLEQLRTVTNTASDPEKPIVVPRYSDGRPGNPVLLERGAWALAGSLEGDRGMSQLFDAHPELVRYVDVEGQNPDIDTADDLAAAQPRSVVAAGYDSLGDRYLEWATRIADPVRERMLADFGSRLPPGGAVLDLGCGPGLPSTKQLADTFDVTGVDFSAAQIAAARLNVPNARFIEADMTTIDFPAGTFDGVVALYSFTHVPRAEQPALVARIARWLRPGGIWLATLSAEGTAGWTGKWLGVEMFFSGFDAAGNRDLLARAGFELLIDEVVETEEPEGPVRFHWVLAQVRGG